MNWKPIQNLDGLPDTGNVLVAYDDGSACTEKASEVRDGIIDGIGWTFYEPPETDEEAYKRWVKSQQFKAHSTCQKAWNDALNWERSKYQSEKAES